MRKFIILAISLVALAIPAAGMATVAVDANGNGSVDKGDVQKALGWNNAAFDLNAGSVKFTQKSVTSVHEALVCNGIDYVYDVTTTQFAPVKANAIKNAGNGRQITGWKLTGVGTPSTITSTTNTDVNAAVVRVDCLMSGGELPGRLSRSTRRRCVCTSTAPACRTPRSSCPSDPTPHHSNTCLTLSSTATAPLGFRSGGR